MIDIIQNILIAILFYLWWNIEHLKGEVVHTEMAPEEFKEFIGEMINGDKKRDNP